MIDLFTRRRLLEIGAAGIASALIPFPIWFARYGAAEAQRPLVRYGVSTRQGSAMLAKYRTAVATMMGRAKGDPCAWVFQWYTHQVRADSTKSAEVASLPSSQQPLANEMWDTCQAHFGRPVRFFLPWHRMYVYFLERIVRKACGDPAFTLPYWNYLNSAQRALPAAFWNNTSSPLFRPDRNSTSNSGQPIDQGYPPNTINADCMNEADYLPAGGALGFCSAINGSPHGIVHSLTGNGLGMGSVPWAANDPIFWLHHCNIDRMWASWNAGGRSNPPDAAWRNQQFVFADENCNRVLVKVSDFGAIGPLGYSYDHLLPTLNAALLDRLRNLRLIAIWRPRGPGPDPEHVGIALDRRPVTVSLTPAAGAANLLTARNLASAAIVRLNVRNLRTNIVPATLYDIYLNVPAGTRPEAARQNYAGSITFFDAVSGGHEGHDANAGGEEGPSFTFDVTNLVKRLRLSGRLDVTIVPHGAPAADARPVIGNIELVAG